jgi:hypothetical protein
VKGAEVFMRVFPDIPVCVKGNETRMGKGKGSFEYWACRVPLGRVVFEVGGGGIREEIAKQGKSRFEDNGVEDVEVGIEGEMDDPSGRGHGRSDHLDLKSIPTRVRTKLMNSIKTCSNEITSPNGIHYPQHPIPSRNTLNIITRSTISRFTRSSTIGGIGR